MRLAVALLLLLFVSCSCKSPPTVVDAGTPIERGTDLRSAITTVFPEYRGAALLRGRVAITREVGPAGEAELEKAKRIAGENGFKGEPPSRDGFSIEQRLEGGKLLQEIRLGLSNDDVGRILAAPASMTSEAIAHWLPKVGPKLGEELDLELLWVAKDVARADFLVWQVTDGALATGWKADALPSGWQLERVDGGPVVVPTEFTLMLRHEHLGATFELERKGDRARLRYRLKTFERR